MKVKVIADFRDREHNLKLRKEGEVFEVSKERAAKLEGLELVTAIMETDKEEPPEAKEGGDPDISQ